MTETRFDVLVIGAGIAGVSVAAALGETVRVCVLERESQPGMHATGRSAALFSANYGPEPIRALSRASQSFFEAPPTAFSPATLVRRRGVMSIATQDQASAFQAFIQTPDIAAVVRRLSPEEALALCPILKPGHVAFAAIEPDAADIDVDALLQGFLRKHRAQGGVVVADAEATGLERDGGLWIATTAAGRFAAPILVNAAGAWADPVAALAGARPLGVEPRRRTAVLVDPPAGADVAHWPMVLDVEEQFYFKPDAGLLLLCPADATPSVPCDAHPEELDVAIAVDRVETATTLNVRRVKHSWAGLRSFAADGVPVVGFDPRREGLFWLAGQGGYGLQTAPALARTAAALVLGQALDADLVAAGVRLEALSPARFAP